MRQTITGVAAFVGAALLAGAASAATVVVTSSDPHGWSNPSDENSGGGSASITSTSARSGTGSLETHGDRTRYVLGDLYASGSNLGLFSDFTDLAFEYQIDPASTHVCCDAKYSPALRIVVWDHDDQDALVKYDFVWEQAYQPGGYGAAADIGEWNTIAAGGGFYKNGASPLDDRSLATWSGTLSSSAYVGAVYIGVGSGIGSGYTAYVDNITAGGTTYNFEAGAAPEPAAWALMIMGFGAAGATIRRRRGVLAA
jgi:hypothetical protein